jgi:hypothetical protein
MGFGKPEAAMKQLLICSSQDLVTSQSQQEMGEGAFEFKPRLSQSST